MEKTYQPAAIEQRWTQFWEENKFAKPQGEGEPYCIMLPPPNVTGTLHMGHGFQLTLMDALIRRQRMLGKRVLWQPGTDHASIATQMVVERQLAQEGLSRHDLGREKFLERVNQWCEQSSSIITQQIRRMGASLDWERERYSMDAVITKATYAAFIRLFDEGLIYRGKRMVNWDPHLHTAISDLEVSTESAAGHLWYLRYPIVNSSEYIVVATTRPETLLGDVAVAVHPEDPRYQALIGKTIRLPLTQREIPIIGDTAVDSEFGTGCVKITPAHDFNDYEMGKRHQLPVINIFTLSADLNENVPKNYRGLGRVAARKQVVADMEAQGLLEKVENYTVNLPRGDRSGVILEPMLTDQWFVRMNEMAQSAIAAARQSRPAFVPENWNKTYLQWLNNIEDWCISRQLWWGHRVPIWYDQNQKPYPGYDEADVRKRYSLSADTRLRQDEDILDTWFTAALYPFSTLHWPDQTPELKTFYPGQVMVTGFDIIFFWVARMVMMGLKLMGDIPFQEVYIHGLVRDQQGQKMSKSKGNILDPIDLMDGIDLEKLISKRTTGLMQPQMAPAIKKTTTAEFPQGIAAYGADALRLTFCALATTGRDINFDMNRISGYRNFCNKLWNAARYVLMNTENQEVPLKETPLGAMGDRKGENRDSPPSFRASASPSAGYKPGSNSRCTQRELLAENKDLGAENIQYSLADRWIRSQLQTTIAQVNAAFAEYRFDIIAHLIYEFTWNEYCDWYLELSKPVLTDAQADPALQRGARRTLLEILETLLRLLHPLIPFITEEIWQTVAPMIQTSPAKSIMIAPYPQADSRQQDPQAIAAIDWLKQVVNGIRNVRGEMRVAPGKLISVFFHKGSEQDRQYSQETEILIKNLAKAGSLTWLAEDASPSPASAVIVLGQLEIIIPLADLVDKNAELVRLQKEIDKLKREQEKLSSRLENADYTQKAPAAVVEKERQNFQQITATLDKLQSNYQKIKEL